MSGEGGQATSSLNLLLFLVSRKTKLETMLAAAADESDVISRTAGKERAKQRVSAPVEFV